MAPQIQPSLDSIKSYINDLKDQTDAPNLYPIHSFLPALDVNPHVAYLRIARPGDTENKPQPSFLFESTLGGENLGRYSFIGSAPRKTIITGNGHGPDVDPLDLLEEELSQFRQVQLPSIPSLSGGAIGYVGYDCVRYFEPKTLRENQKDPINLPEAALMLFDTVIAFDHVFQKIQIIHNIHLPTSSDPEGTREARYQEGIETINKIADILQNGQDYHPPQPPIVPNAEFTSNIGREGLRRPCQNIEGAHPER